MGRAGEPSGRTHLPFALVGCVVLLGFLRMYLAHWREGAVLLGGALLLAGALRVAFPGEKLGLLTIRSRAVDVGLYCALGLLIVIVAVTIRRAPFG